MSDMPKEIWVIPIDNRYIAYPHRIELADTKYTRSDHHTAEVERLEAEIQKRDEVLKECMNALECAWYDLDLIFSAEKRRCAEMNGEIEMQPIKPPSMRHIQSAKYKAMQILDEALTQGGDNE